MYLPNPNYSSTGLFRKALLSIPAMFTVHNATAIPPTKSPNSTTAPYPLAAPELKGVGVPMKVPLYTVVLFCIMVPLPVGVAVPLTIAAVEKVVELMSMCPPTGAHGLEAYALVTVIGAISTIFCRKMMPQATKETDYHFVRQRCNSWPRTCQIL